MKSFNRQYLEPIVIVTIIGIDNIIFTLAEKDSFRKRH